MIVDLPVDAMSRIAIEALRRHEDAQDLVDGNAGGADGFERVLDAGRDRFTLGGEACTMDWKR